MNQTMPPRLKELLEGSDFYLFTGGGCHVFARALLQKLRSECYELALVVDESESVGFHVVAQNGDLVVDALGIRTANNLLSWYAGYKNRIVKLRPITEVELFDAETSSNDSIPKNKWGHHLMPSFVDKCLDRAFGVIENVPERFKVSVLRKGQEIVGVTKN